MLSRYVNCYCIPIRYNGGSISLSTMKGEKKNYICLLYFELRKRKHSYYTIDIELGECYFHFQLVEIAA